MGLDPLTIAAASALTAKSTLENVVKPAGQAVGVLSKKSAPPSVDLRAREAAADELQRRRASSRRGTILTSPLGVIGQGPVQRPTLLGGTA